MSMKAAALLLVVHARAVYDDDSPHCAQADDCDAETNIFSLMQVSHGMFEGSNGSVTRTIVNDDAHVQPRPNTFLEPVKPVYWLHVPKCNSGFIRSVALLPSVCPNMSQRTRSVLTDESLLSNTVLRLYMYLLDPPIIIEDECPGGVSDRRDLGVIFGDHSGIDSFYFESVKGRGMIILRQPEQRLISAWNDNFHSWPSGVLGRSPDNMSEFASYVSGCATKMLTRSKICVGLCYKDAKERSSLTACGDPQPISKGDSELAVARLKEGFSFVGTIERYDLSICLLHAMFGGECTSAELGEAHTSNISWYDTSDLNGWQDVYDRRLYAEAEKILDHNLELYGVNDVYCQPCWAQKT